MDKIDEFSQLESNYRKAIREGEQWRLKWIEEESVRKSEANLIIVLLQQIAELESAYDETEKRIKQIEVFLYNCTWEKFTVNDAIKCLEHIKMGGGWL